MSGWTRFVGGQILIAVASIVGVVVLLPMAYAEFTFGDKWEFFDGVFGNSEDGCHGPAWYNPSCTPWRTYMWSAWRNSAHNLAVRLSWKGGPFWRWTNKANTFYVQAGYRRDTGFPVISAGTHNGSPWVY